MLLSLAAVKAACRAALADGSLLALNPEAARGEYDGEIHCRYEATDKDGRVYRCAIGVALDRNTLDDIENAELQGEPVTGLLYRDPEDAPDIDITVENDAELRAMAEIQMAHDDWLRGDGVGSLEDKRARFIRLIAE